MKPNLFIVGAPKSGTTSLHYYLSQHPQIYMSSVKEPDFFCRDLIESSVRMNRKRNLLLRWYYNVGCKSKKEYMSFFSSCRSKKICGEASGRYLYSKTSARDIHRFNPKAKIVIIVRDPVDLIHSLHSYQYSHMSEDISDFGEALRAEALRKRGKRIPSGARWPSMLFYSEVGKLGEQVQRYVTYFGKNVKVIVFDDLKDNIEGVYKDLVRFLEVSNFKPDFKAKNINTVLRFGFLRRLPFVWKLLRKSLPETVYENLKGLALKAEKREPMDKSLQRKLMKQYKGQVKKLSRIIRRDLVKLWGYDKV